MEKYIRAVEAAAKLCERFDILLTDLVDIMAEIPAVDVEPVRHGRWIGTADGYADGELVYDMWKCSACGFDADGADEKPGWRYCPNCGCKMDLEDEK